MNDLFKELFRNKGLSDEQIEKLSVQFSVIAFFTLLKGAEDKLSQEEQDQVRTYIQEGNYNQVATLIKSKYEEAAWRKLLDTHIAPLFDSYVQEVAQAD